MEAVVVTHNSVEDLRGLPRATLAAFDRVVVVDSGSTDESCATARALGAEVVEADNRGFGAAANTGAGMTAGPVFALMNPDIRFGDAVVVDAMAAQFERNPRVGLAAPALRLPDGRIQDSARAIPVPLDLIRRRWIDRLGGYAKRTGELLPERPSAVPWVVAACVFVRREAFDRTGGFDPRFFMYFEDVDLCVRLRRAGWHVLVDPAVVVEHAHRGASRRPLSSVAARHHMRSALRFYGKHPRYALGVRRASDLRARAGA
jgi:N-acetylglucosaminyl-diphospho-decaprenol L-rhamnosyltransferase